MTRTHEVHLQRVLPASPARVWQALVDPAELGQWLAAAEVVPGLGGTVSIFFEEDHNVRNGKILQWQEPHTLEYEWIFNGEEPSILRIDLAEHPQGTLLTLQHRLLPTHLTNNYDSGWLAYLDRLSGYFQGTVPDFMERYEHWVTQKQSI